MMNRKMTRLVLFFVCTIIITIITFNFFPDANKVQGASNSPIKSYITISVEPHDTLWDLANTYMNSDYYDQKSYIAEVIAINNISNAAIFSGDHLTLPVID